MGRLCDAILEKHEQNNARYLNTGLLAKMINIVLCQPQCVSALKSWLPGAKKIIKILKTSLKRHSSYKDNPQLKSIFLFVRSIFYLFNSFFYCKANSVEETLIHRSLLITTELQETELVLILMTCLSSSQPHVFNAFIPHCVYPNLSDTSAD